MLSLRISLIVILFLEGQHILSAPYFDLQAYTDECDVTRSNGCTSNHCCVYQVIVNRSNNFTVMTRQRCQPLRTDGELCLVNPENFMCFCQDELVCQTEDNENFGHCVPKQN